MAKEKLTREQKTKLRADYNSILEDILEAEEVRGHWGKKLPEKMEQYPRLAKEALGFWARKHGLELRTPSWIEGYSDGLYGVLKKTLDQATSCK